ncbi:hypothetical protein DUI87_18372 [Hirundo rustica rustica]|uniref:Uncharacterized protein n=1 Tax=Hirundo rustica rustica TaxID=333673 RepID=A0A3M0JWQ3_HIRRU|nr:hypothetical protein DUI87_18372 [Hirundo rustica rustica]
MKGDWTRHRALEDTTCDQLSAGCNSIHHPSLGLVTQAVLYTVKSTSVQVRSSQFLQENDEGKHGKGFTTFEVDSALSLSSGKWMTMSQKESTRVNVKPRLIKVFYEAQDPNSLPEKML